MAGMEPAALQQLAADCKVLYKELPDEAKRFVKKAFVEMDADWSGTVSRAELYKAMKKWNPDLDSKSARLMTKEAMEMCDVDSSGQLDFDECITLMVLTMIQPFGCDGCDKWLVLDSHFFACALCWDNAQKDLLDLRCDGEEGGCYILCERCAHKTVQITHSDEFACISCIQRSEHPSEWPILGYHEVCAARGKILTLGLVAERADNHDLSSQRSGVGVKDPPRVDYCDASENSPVQQSVGSACAQAAARAAAGQVVGVAAEYVAAEVFAAAAVGACTIM